ncbi:unnamed protein product [Adineta steineri]|uniref:Zinc-binding loop region of homing endonuclease domain-containing protein n=1 Tax=Adineta steineri TaxID=433720 RepID=A0A819KMU5_9BILA|nr:unnamed protein product [Adineta steineri]CAF3947938.1 unnamed protein product [Adineta steineri]
MASPTSETSLPITFLNDISNTQAATLSNKILDRHHYEEKIIREHVDEEIRWEKIKSFTSVASKHGIIVLGSFFAEWMSCEIRKKHLDKAPCQHPVLNFKQNSLLIPSITKKLIEFCDLNSAEEVGVQIHHITLRSKMPSLPLLSCEKGAREGSHLCSTLGCVSKQHIIIESEEDNQSRQTCFGVLLQVHQSGSDIGCIVKIKPCFHGRKLNTNLHDQVKYSCRKIQVVISEQEHEELYK